MQCFTSDFVSDVIMPELYKSGGATVSTSNGNVYPHLDTPENVYREYVLCGFPGTSTQYVGLHGRIDYMVEFAANWQLDQNVQHTYSGVGFWLHEGLIHVDYVETYTLHAMAVECALRNHIGTLHRIHGMPYGQCCETVTPAYVPA